MSNAIHTLSTIESTLNKNVKSNVLLIVILMWSLNLFQEKRKMTKQIMFAGIIWYLVFALTHAFLSDGFRDCLSYFYNNEAPQLFSGIKDTDRCVCQEYNNSVHFATFYDVLRKIPH